MEIYVRKRSLDQVYCIYPNLYQSSKHIIIQSIVLRGLVIFFFLISRKILLWIISNAATLKNHRLFTILLQVTRKHVCILDIFSQNFSGWRNRFQLTLGHYAKIPNPHEPEQKLQWNTRTEVEKRGISRGFPWIFGVALTNAFFSKEFGCLFKWKTWPYVC